jgi:hypothetical protein
VERMTSSFQGSASLIRRLTVCAVPVPRRSMVGRRVDGSQVKDHAPYLARLRGVGFSQSRGRELLMRFFPT